MCQLATTGGVGFFPGWARLLTAAGLLSVLTAAAQSPAGSQPDWRRIGNRAVDAALASPASGPVDRVWFSADGSRLFALTASGRVFETSDCEKWQASPATPPPDEPDPDASAVRPADAGRVRQNPADPTRLYAYGRQVFRSDDGGASWTNLTAFRRNSIIGDGMRDLAVSPRNGEEIVVANEAGVWRSVDGGLSWTGLNESLPNLPVSQFAGLPSGPRGVRIATQAGIFEWTPGEKLAWRGVRDGAAEQNAALRQLLSARLRAEVTAAAAVGDVVYAGTADGRILVSFDKGQTWNSAAPARGPIESLYVDPKDPGMALAAVGGDARGGRAARVLRSINGGQFWDDLTANLPDAAAHGITADRASGALYVATDKGVFFTRAELNAAGPATPWTALAGLPEARALDARLDPEGNQLFVALEGYGVYAAMGVHRAWALRVVNAADFSARPAAPGSLLSVLGGRVRSARAGELTFPVLAASDSESQLQVPFDAGATAVSLSLDTGTSVTRLSVPIESVSPAIFVDRDGTPLVLNADSGVLLDAMSPARSNARLQVLVTGLGRTRPEWPTGVAGPVENPPVVASPVRVYLDRAAVEVSRAVLAPGYIGLYLVEIQLPGIVNSGPAELFMEAGNQQSNRVRVWIEP